MVFAEWIKRHPETITEVACRLKLHRTTLHRWILGSDLPRPETIARVEHLTHGRVTYADFLAAYEAYKKAKP